MTGPTSDFPQLVLRVRADAQLGKSRSLDGLESYAQRCEAEGQCSMLPEARVVLKTLSQDRAEGELFWERPDKSGELVVAFSAPLRIPGSAP
jgi:hypothetical protein